MGHKNQTYRDAIGNKYFDVKDFDSPSGLEKILEIVHDEVISDIWKYPLTSVISTFETNEKKHFCLAFGNFLKEAILGQYPSR